MKSFRIVTATTTSMALTSILETSTVTTVTSTETSTIMPISCDGEVGNVTIPGTIITSPNFPNNYPNYQDCEMLITMPKGTLVLLDFLSLNIESSWWGLSCNDWLEVFDGSDASVGTDRIGEKICGNETPNQMAASGNTLFISFRSNYAGSSAGFQIKVDVGMNLIF